MLNRPIILSLLLSLLSVGVCAAARVQGTPIPITLANPSFETGTDTPANWTPLDQYAGDTYLWETATAAQGQRSLSIQHTRYRYGRWASDPINVTTTGFNWYTLSGQVKTEENNGEVYLALAWYDAQAAMLATSDSPLLPFGDNDWQQLTVDALPPDGASTVRVWCISNHNRGTTHFDNLSLTGVQFPAKGAASYDNFLKEYPAQPLAIAASLMRVGALMTQAKWIKEAGFYDPDARREASELYAQAAKITVPTAGFQLAAAAAGVTAAAAQDRFESLIDAALWQAVTNALDAGETALAIEHLTEIVSRNRSPEMKAAAEQLIQELKGEQ